MCYIETKNLDGETNLKHKGVPKDLVKMIPKSVEELSGLQLLMEYEKPNPYL